MGDSPSLGVEGDGWSNWKIPVGNTRDRGPALPGAQRLLPVLRGHHPHLGHQGDLLQGEPQSEHGPVAGHQVRDELLQDGSGVNPDKG